MQNNNHYYTDQVFEDEKDVEIQFLQNNQYALEIGLDNTNKALKHFENQIAMLTDFIAELGLDEEYIKYMNEIATDEHSDSSCRETARYYIDIISQLKN
ncbi:MULTISPECIES: hypothetical protein [Bacillus]|uniref:hypothetical protein n=1 Tax=Bacillus TaxID=1386 RepID=UPI0011A4D3D8|nr:MULTISPECIES: hypothetical protein [Bacillus]MCP1148014.1 hypothetical protein [Bacillus sp. 1735sda2]